MTTSFCSALRYAGVLILWPALLACNTASMETEGSPKDEEHFLGLKTSEQFTGIDLQHKVDILFIDDNSSSMDVQQQSLGDKFSSFASAVNGLDWQIGITTTDCSMGAYGICGALLQMGTTGSRILTPSVPNFSTVFKNTIVRPETIGCQSRNDCPSGDSVPLKATVNAFRKRDGFNTGFFRDRAALAVIMLTNADEDNLNPVSTSTTPQMVLDELKNIWGDKKVMRTYAIGVLLGDAACLAQQQTTALAAYSTYPIALANATGGMSVSICSSDYSPILNQIGADLNSIPNFIQLAHRPNPKTLKVVLSPDPGITWTLQYDSIYFAAPIPAQTQIRVEYEY